MLVMVNHSMPIHRLHKSIVLFLVNMAVTLPFVFCGCAEPTMPAKTARQLQTFGQIVVDLSHPVMEGRGVGTDGLEQARNYLIARFKAAGLLPAFGNRYVQPFTVDLGPQVKQQLLELADANGQITPEWFKDGQYSVLGMSADDAFEGQAVFVGYGSISEENNYDSYMDAEPDTLAGKIAIAFRYEPMDECGRSLWTGRHSNWTQAAHSIRKANWAAEHGAVALLVVNPPWLPLTGPLQSTQFAATATRADIPVFHIRQSLVETMLRKAGRDPLAALNYWQHHANRNTLKIDQLEGVFVRGESRLDDSGIMVENIGGLVAGVGVLADEVVLVGAHYDHLGYGEVGSFMAAPRVHPGADDNASGCAALAMLAERFGQRSVIDSPIEGQLPRRTIVFTAFTGEERGLLGSGHLVEHLGDLGIELEQIVAMINMDMIGRMRSDKVMIGGVGTSDQWQSLIDSANESVDLNIETWGSGRGPSDHTTFYNARVPVLHFFTGVHKDYHRPSDTADKINAEGGMRVVELVDHIVMDLWTEWSRLAFTGTDDPARSGVISH